VRQFSGRNGAGGERVEGQRGRENVEGGTSQRTRVNIEIASGEIGNRDNDECRRDIIGENGEQFCENDGRSPDKTKAARKITGRPALYSGARR
jgi:hypothetical protein